MMGGGTWNITNPPPDLVQSEINTMLAHRTGSLGVRMDRDELRKALDRDELDYPALAEEAGPESIDDLEALVAEDEPRIAPKAAYLAALINAEGSERVVDLAARSRHDVVRASAAAALGSLTEDLARADR